MKMSVRSTVAGIAVFAAVLVAVTGSVVAQGATPDDPAATRSDCAGLPDHDRLRDLVTRVVDADGNGGLGQDMWVSVVNRDGIVCAVAFSGANRGAQWPGSRLIAAQKAYTANAFSLPPGSRGALPGLALSTANLYSAVQPGGSLFGLADSNPIDPTVAYAGNPAFAGQRNDPLVGKKLGGINVFGGGLALYTPNALVGGVGVSGDESCTDHVIAWKIRDALALDYVPTGVRPRPDGDNIIYDIRNGVSASGYGHPTCNPPATQEAAELPIEYPLG